MRALEEACAHHVGDGEVITQQPLAALKRRLQCARGVGEPLLRGRLGDAVAQLGQPAEQRPLQFGHREQDPLVDQRSL